MEGVVAKERSNGAAGAEAPKWWQAKQAENEAPNLSRPQHQFALPYMRAQWSR